VTARRPFHNLLRRTIGAAIAAIVDRGWRGPKGVR
jgi:hypothetical protein